MALSVFILIWCMLPHWRKNLPFHSPPGSDLYRQSPNGLAAPASAATGSASVLFFPQAARHLSL